MTGATTNTAAEGVLNHPALGPVRYSTREVSDDPDTQVAEVIGMMREYALTDASSPEIQADLLRMPTTSDPIADVYSYVKGQMHFVRDEETALPLADWYNAPIVETLVRPRDMAIAQSPQGDCDDFAMYGACLLHARGVPVAFCTVAADPQSPTTYSHVYLIAYPTSGPYAGQRVPLDLSHGPYPGWETENRLGKRAEWPLTGGSGWVFLLGLALIACHTLGGGRLGGGSHYN